MRRRPTRGNYNCGSVVATSMIFSQTSGSSFDVNINRLLGTCMGLALGNIPALVRLFPLSHPETLPNRLRQAPRRDAF